ncbi:nucleotide sugar dehydrogenase [Flavobacteriaceae bacterium]|nr:nucleotide sugar dehydrogenase [Flavobacteriaceae bacterium]
MNPTIGIIGLGYVGLPLALALAEKYTVLGYDNNPQRIAALHKGIDSTQEITSKELQAVNINYFDQSAALKECSIYIITVPTPLKEDNLPDFSYLESASEVVAKMLKKGDIVVYESTVYPGATEEICLPILELSSLKVDSDFSLGYSPERINVGDPVHTFTSIPKIVSASNQKALATLTHVYQSILSAEVYQAPSIKVAEAAKVIENTQRDVNIAFVNELAMMFNAMGLDTNEVLAAAATKWNFLPFRPGLVGGHCIGIDPYYLAHKSKALGYTPDLLLSARKINEAVPHFIVDDIIDKLNIHQVPILEAKVLLLGATFKENTTDLRNSKAITLAQALKAAGVDLVLYDPLIAMDQTTVELAITNMLPENKKYDAVILAVGHDQFNQIDPLSLLTEKGFGYDIKAYFDIHPRIYRL